MGGFRLEAARTPARRESWRAMRVKMDGMEDHIEISSEGKIQLLEVTSQVQQAVARLGPQSGVCLLYCPHTTAGLIINENADPDVRTDLEAAFRESVPAVQFRHGEGNSPAHYLASITGSSLLIPIADSHLQLGRWQGIFFCEFDGPRRRRLVVQVLPR